MPARDATIAVLGIPAFVFVSSFLGLTGTFVWIEPSDALSFFVGIWSASLVADVVFTIGSALAAVLAYQLARRGGGWYLGAAAASLAANWLVYLSSFLLLPENVSERGADDLLDSAGFVGAWGWMGLAFATLAPPLAALWSERRERATSARSR